VNPSVSVVILNYNGAKFLRQFLPLVVNYSGDAHIVVADNGSTDESAVLVAREFPQVQCLVLGSNFGFCGGYNRALAQLTTPYVVLLNSDVAVTPGWLEPMIALMERDSSVAAVQPKIRSFHQRDYFEYAGAAGGYLDSMGYPFCRGRLFHTLEKDEGQYNDTREVFWATGACFVIRAAEYHRMGGLEESFFAHMEEIDLCWRLHRAGKKVMVCGECTVYHVGGGTLPKANPRKTYFNFRNSLWLLLYHMPGFQLLWKLPLRLLLDYLAALKFAVSGSPSSAWAVVKAHAATVLMWQKILKRRTRLREQFPYSRVHIYCGSILWDYYIRGKKKVIIS
jgi:hypothetical protein